MHLVYIDEVKHDPPRRPHFWLCALACPEASILELERRVTTIVSDYFGASTLSQGNELHAREILWGKGIYRGRPQQARLALYQRLVDVIDEADGLCRIQIRIDPRRVVAATYRDKAFMFLVEKVDSLMAAKKSLALLISDEDHEFARDNVASLSAFKARGTSYTFGRPINRVVDTVHHTKSRDSRLLQLADVYSHTCSLVAGDCSTEPKKTIEAYARTKQNVLFPTKYKHWPSQFSWYASA